MLQVYKLQVILPKLSTKDRAIQEKAWLAHLEADTTFMQKKRYAELHAESFRPEVTLEDKNNGRHKGRW